MSIWLTKPLNIEAELPAVQTKTEAYRNETINMNNLPATIDINGTVWTRTISASANGTYSYGSHGGTSNDIANNPHYTVSPVGATTEIYNVHYTVPGPNGGTRYYYYRNEAVNNRYQPMPMPNAIGQQLKFLVDKLLFEWTWFYTSTSAFGPATKAQVGR